MLLEKYILLIVLVCLISRFPFFFLFPSKYILSPAFSSQEGCGLH